MLSFNPHAQYLNRLKNNGLKLTPRRQAMIQLFVDSGAHLTPEEVWKKLHQQFTKCGLPSVYRNLESLVECGILARIQLTDRKKHYGLCTVGHEHHHHHITCIKCGKVDEITDCPLTHTVEINGYRVISHFLQLNGICGNCLEN